MPARIGRLLSGVGHRHLVTVRTVSFMSERINEMYVNTAAPGMKAVF